jgi:hypothetical protein
MGEINNQSSTHRIQTAFLKTNLRGYDWYFHSTKNSRGVGMLIKKTLCLIPVAEYKDQDENIFIIKFEHENNLERGGGGCPWMCLLSQQHR